MPEKIRKRIKTRLRKILGIPPPPKAPEKVPYDDTYDKARAAGKGYPLAKACNAEWPRLRGKPSGLGPIFRMAALVATCLE